MVAFETHLMMHGGGEMFFAPTDVVFSEINVVEPDLLFVPDDLIQILTEKNIRGAPARRNIGGSIPTPTASRSTS